MSIYDDAQRIVTKKGGPGDFHGKRVAQALIDLTEVAEPVATRSDYANQYRSFRDADDNEMFPVRLGDLRVLRATLQEITKETM